MKRFAFACMSLCIVTAMTGCYCWNPYGCSGAQYGYGAGGGCQYGNCGVQPSGSLPPGAFYQSYDSVQAGLPTPVMSAAPGYPRTAAAPLESLPTY